MKKLLLSQTLNQAALSCVFAIATITSQTATAQTKPPLAPIGQPASFEMSIPNGTSLDLNSLKGKVVMIYHWSTNCSVCLDKMMELRDNTAGWVNRPFALIAVNHDAKKQDYQDYVRILSALKTAPVQMQFVYYKDVVQDSLYKSNVGLPQTYLIDSLGLVKNVFNGRIPGQAWDQVAELLP